MYVADIGKELPPKENRISLPNESVKTREATETLDFTNTPSNKGAGPATEGISSFAMTSAELVFQKTT